MDTSRPITEDDLHALADGQLEASRLTEVDAYLREHPGEACRVAAWTIQRQQLRALFSPVLDEPIPKRLERAATPHRRWPVWQMAASVLIAVTGGLTGWSLHDMASHTEAPSIVASSAESTQLVQHAAMAHAVYAADARRPVEITAAQEDQLVTWLSKRMGAQMNPPDLRPLGYQLEGGRLLPGRAGPVAQFMYQDSAGMRLTLYVAHEASPASSPSRQSAPPDPTTAFRFAQDGSVNVFYWIDSPFGYAISSYAGRTELARISAAVFRQLDPNSSGQPAKGREKRGTP